MRGKVYLPHFTPLNTTVVWGRTAKVTGPQSEVPPMDSPMVCKALGVKVNTTNQIGQNDALFNNAVVRLTDKQIETMQPNPDKEVSLLISAQCVKFAPEWQRVTNASELKSKIRRGITGYGTAQKLFDALDINDTMGTDVNLSCRLLHFQMDRVVQVQGVLVNEAYQEVKNLYPALFPLDEGAIEDYINQQTKTTTKEITI